MAKQMLITKAIRAKMEKNYKENAKRLESPIDFEPVVKLFHPYGAGTWLLTEIDEHNIAFGLCDLGQGFPELGYVSIDELESLKDKRFGFQLIERDTSFKPVMALSKYASQANQRGYISA